MNLLWFFVFFFVSGFCSLIYEVVWLRLAMAKFGVTTPMVSIVLSVFMAGLALGSWAGGALVRRFDRHGSAALLRLYGAAEMLIGVSGLLVPYLLQTGYQLMQKGETVAWDSSLFYLVSGSCVVVSLLPWCTCMGATFPLGMAAIRKNCAVGSEHSFSYLYVANVLGAVCGTLLPAFVLIELLGFMETLRVATYLNWMLAATVFAVSVVYASSDSTPSRRTPLQSATATCNFSERQILWLLFASGLTTMAMEVTWIRQFTVYLGNVVYSFAVILAVYLAATWTGSFVYRSWLRRPHLEPRATAAAWVFLGLASLLPLAFSDLALPVPYELFWSVSRTVAGIFPFSALLGFLTPLLVDSFSRGDPHRGGSAYAVNIVGAILGPLVAGFWMLPWLGDHGALAALSLPLFGMGLLAVMRQEPGVQIQEGRFGIKALYFLVVLLSIALVTVTKGIEAGWPERVELRDHTATVIATGDGLNKRLIVNGIGMTSLTPITKYMAHLPLAFLNRPPENALVICFGMGTTYRSLLSWGIDATVVELVPSVPKLFGYYHADAPKLMASPLGHIVIDDGRRFLERSAATYDVITLDPPPPITTPTTSLLYSREFYAVVKQRLRPGGIFHAWLAIQDPGWDISMQASFSKALAESFPYVRAFPALHGIGMHFLASNDEIPFKSAEQLAARMPPAASADFVEWGPYSSAEEMFAAVLQTEQSMSRLVALDPRIPPLQDDRPINEYFFLRRFFDRAVPLRYFGGPR